MSLKREMSSKRRPPLLLVAGAVYVGIGGVLERVTPWRRMRRRGQGKSCRAQSFPPPRSALWPKPRNAAVGRTSRIAKRAPVLKNSTGPRVQSLRAMATGRRRALPRIFDRPPDICHPPSIEGPLAHRLARPLGERIGFAGL